MTQSERNIKTLENGERLFEPDPDERPHGLHNKHCDCPWCVEEQNYPDLNYEADCMIDGGW